MAEASGAAAALARGAAWVAAHGDALERSLCATLVGRGRPSGAVAALESECGGAPLDVPRALRVLRFLDDARAQREPLAEKVCAWLAGTQAPDGSFGGVFETGMLAGHLAKTPFARTETLDAACDWLAAGFAPERVKGFAWGNVAAYAHCFANVPHDAADAILQWCGRELERGYRTGLYDAVRTARVLVWCDAGALPGAGLGASPLAEAIVASQEADGGWLAPDDPSPPGRAAHTLDALVALSRFLG